MYKVYDRWPEIAKEMYESKQDIVNFENIEHVVFVGMGGSGALSDIFSSILSKTKIHVEVVKGYHLPSTVDSNSLVVTSSISGNTVETLSVLDAAYKSGCKIIAFSGGGKMQEYCSKHKIEYRNIPQIHSPRASFPRFLYTIVKVLRPILPVKEKDIFDAINELEDASTKL